MPSLISGYTYDVFISYRQKDNLTPDKDTSGWVSEFVARLKKEVQATIKEDISIYFDENPFDGLLETHDVNESLKDKLKCLIFIPILSQTYCDQKSFAWSNEFLVFKTLAIQDAHGMKVKLHNGNVAGRILPVCIHDLDAADRNTIEKEIGPLRCVDFIFRSPGVNRPLTPTDKRDDSPSKIIYKDQVNKVANAVKDIVMAMREPSSAERLAPAVKNSTKPSSSIFGNGKYSIPALLIAGFVIAAIVIYLLNSGQTKPTDKSIAVLPFVNMSADQDLEYLGDGIAEEIINSLTSIRDLRIVGRTSSFQFKGEKLDLREIGKKLNVAIVLEGSIQQSGNKMRITAQLIRTEDNFHVWSKRYDVEETDIFKIQDNIAANIVETLNLTLTSNEQDRLVKKETSEDAYTIYLKGLFQYKKENYPPALDFFHAVIAMDSLYAPAHAYLALSKAWIIIRSRDLDNFTKTDDAIRSAEKAITLDPGLPEGYSGRALIAWAIQHDFVKARTYFEKSLDLDPGSSLTKNRFCYFLTWMGEFDKATKLAREAMKIDPVDYNSYTILYLIHLYSGKLQEANTYHKELINVQGSNYYTVSRQIQLSFYGGNYKKTNQLCDSLVKAGNKLSQSDLSYNSMAYFALHENYKSDEYLRELTRRPIEKNSTSYYDAARAFAFRHQVDSCFSYLDRALTTKDVGLNRLKIDPAFKDLHSDPRFVEIYSAYGFDKY